MSAAVRLRAWLVCAAFAVVAVPAVAKHRASPKRRFAPKAITAQLYYPSTGLFDSRDLVPGKLVLRNVFIGEGAAAAPVGGVLVRAEFAPSGEFVKPGAREAFSLSAFVAGRKVATVSVPVAREDHGTGNVWIPLLVYGEVLCSSLEVVASFGDGPGNELRESIPFTCGE